ncbi:hypothetical protein RRG08_031934 [Elysia crispata]|uniref:Peroxidase n=1 Tax=Elysia crispata TaxID=231223 RepID=A0AAE1AHL6_9GAST|nr:hypothetical protein RRG08_031934 [Elysia crispata]
MVHHIAEKWRSAIQSSAIPRYKSVSGNLLPSAREVSMKCFEPDDSSENLDKVFTQMHMQFGQFLDHDIILTELEAASNCCADMAPDGTHPDMFNGLSCFPMKVGDNDRFFTEKCITARRSLGVDVDGVRQQINGVTSFIDASQVYGPAKLLSDELRTFQGGKMKTTKEEKDGKVIREDLPQIGVFKCLKDTISHCPHAGDPRVNVFPGLTIIHTAFHLEHNRIAEELAAVNPTWDDEKLFQEARKIVIAINQLITYEEYLPKIIGPDMMNIMGLDDAFAYDAGIDASVTNVFGAAAFRFGHSQINGPMRIHGSRAPGLSEVFFKPEIMLEESGGVMKNIIINQVKQRCQKTDHLFSPEILDKLFMNVDAPGESFDLPALAVHRARDHGLPTYLDYVDMVVKFLSKFNISHSFVKTLNLPNCLLDGTYESYRDIDLFTGAVYETPVDGGVVGPTFAYLLGEQFRRLRVGDRFFYEASDSQLGFTPAQLADIKKKASLSNVFCKNNKKLKWIQLKAMEKRSSDNPKKSCSSFDDFDFSLWKEG